MLDKLSIKNKTLLYVLSVLVVFSVVLLAIIYIDQKAKLDNVEKNYYEKIKNSYTKIIKQQNEYYLETLNSIVENKQIKTSFEKRDRKELYSQVKTLFDTLKSENKYLKILHFHLPNGTSFLRVHNKDKYGDKISNLRPMVEAIHKRKEVVFGFESGIYNLAYRVFIPIFSQGVYIGALEIGSDADEILEKMKYYNDLQGGLFVEDKGLNIYRKDLSLKILNFNLQYKTLDDNQLFEKLKDTSYKFEGFRRVCLNDKVNMAYSFDMYNFEGKIVSKAVFFQDITSLNNEFLNTLKKLIALLTLFVVCVIVAINIGFRKSIDVIEEAKKEFETIFQTSKDGIAILDLDTNFLFFNKSYLKMTGFSEKELMTKSCAELSAPEDLQRAIEVVAYTIEHGYRENFEKTCIVKDGERVVVNMSLALMPDKKRLLITTKNITEARKKEKLMNEYVSLIDKNIITSSTDLQGNITQVSEAFCQISGYTKEELIGKNHNIVKHKDMSKDLYKELWKTISNGKIWKGEIKNGTKDGGFYWVNATISPIYDEQNNKIGYTAIRQDITDKKMIEQISITDGLTNIYNRRHFNDIFPKILNGARRNNEMICFLLMDIDHFKQYNDTYGHQMGDDVLVGVATCLKETLHRADDYCFRLGGEEFGIVFKTDTYDKAILFSDTIRNNIESLHITHEKNSASEYVTASMGLICHHAKNMDSVERIYKDADDLLYKAKESGRNKVVANR